MLDLDAVRPLRDAVPAAGAPGVRGGDAVVTDIRERRRSRAVQSLGLDQGHRNERLDRVTRLAQTVFDVAMSTVTVVEGDCAWFPSAVGFHGDPMPASDTFCDRTIREDTIVLVPDAREDGRFRDLTAVREMGIRFYAGVPLRDPAGNVLGTFCLYDTEVRTLADDEMATLLDLATWAQQELVSDTEMASARRVQAALLPEAPITGGDWEVRGMCVPSLAVGGDWFDHASGRGVARLSLGDVMGKGTGAALLGAGVRSALRATHEAVTRGADLGRVTTDAVRALQSDLERTESFVTCFTAVVHLDDGRVRWVDAGTGLALVSRQGGTVERLVGRDRPFGVIPDDTWSEHTTHLAPGDRLVVVSDGVLDLVDDPATWWEHVDRLTRAATDVTDLLARVAGLVRQRTALDDVTVLAAFRAPAATA